MYDLDKRDWFYIFCVVVPPFICGFIYSLFNH